MHPRLSLSMLPLAVALAVWGVPWRPPPALPSPPLRLCLQTYGTPLDPSGYTLIWPGWTPYPDSLKPNPTTCDCILCSLGGLL